MEKREAGPSTAGDEVQGHRVMERMRPDNSERVRRPVMYQDWCDLTFLHWRYPVHVLRPFVPAQLAIDTFDGSAWVGVTPFVVRNLRPPLTPPVPWLSVFPETNCRTYVRAPDGSRGIWFFSLDAARVAAVVGARVAYGLPYCWSRIRVTLEGTRRRYECVRKWPDTTGRTDIEIEVGEAIEPNELEVFLTARFRLYSFIFGRLTYTRVEHEPWPLRSARAIRLEQTLTSAAGLPAGSGPWIHFSPGVHTKIGCPRGL